MSLQKIKLIIFIIFSLMFFTSPLKANDVLVAQQLLTELGYAPGPIDGSYGGKTRAALENYYAAQNKKFDGNLSSNEIRSLKKSV